MSRVEVVHSSHRSTSHLALSVLVALVVSIGFLIPASAQTDGQDPRARREEIQREQAQVAAQLDVLNATDAELEAAYRTLVENVRQQESRVADAQREVEEAERVARQLQAEADETQAEVDALRARVRERAIASYMNPGSDTEIGDVLLRDTDLNEAERAKALVDQLNSNDLDAVDLYRAAKDRLARQRQEATDAAAAAGAQRDELNEELATLEADRAEQKKTKDALEARIADFQAHAGSLTAEAASIEALIAAAQAPVAPSPPPAAAGDDGSGNGTSTGSSGNGSAGSTNPSTTSGGGNTSPTTSPPVTSPPPSGGGFGWPCGGGINSPYGSRWGGFHSGIDIGCGNGAGVGASKGGTVIFTGFNGGYGNLVLVSHGGGFVTAYAHLSSIVVSNGQSVGAGTYLGAVGCTGSCTGPHLHFEIRAGGSTVNPMSYL